MDHKFPIVEAKIKLLKLREANLRNMIDRLKTEKDDLEEYIKSLLSIATKNNGSL